MTNDRRVIENFVRGKIRWLDGEKASSRAALATLRRGLGKDPAELPEIWEITLTWNGDDARIPAILNISRDGEATRAEWAVHTALTLYALHRQGKTGSMNDEKKREDGVMTRGNSFGAALNILRTTDANKAPGVVRRFNAAITADGLTEFLRHALGIIQLLRAAEQPVKMDYPAFAGDVFQYQFPERRDSVVLKWGRDFWRWSSKEKNANEKESPAGAFENEPKGE